MSETSSPIKSDGYYKITATDTGAYLTVWPPVAGGTSVQKSDIIQDLFNQNLMYFDNDFIALVIKESLGQPIQIINSLLSQDGRYRITTTDGGVQLCVWPPLKDGLAVQKSAIIQDLLSQNLVDFDIDFVSLVIKESRGQPIQIVNSLLSQDGRYKITTTDNGVHLSVWPPIKGGLPVKKSAIIQELANKNFTQFDDSFISQVIKEALGQPTLIVNSVLPTETAPTIRIKIRRDRLQATIEIIRRENSTEITMSELLDKLQSAGVVYGIDKQALGSLLQSRSEASMICASGTPPCEGEKATLKCLIDIDSQGCPEDIEYDRVDFKETNVFLCVEEGQLLIEKIPATPGIPGIDVFGLPIAPKPGRDIPLPTGKNVIAVDDWRLYSGINGHLHMLLPKRINVIPVLQIDGDVDYTTGNIDFKGSVIVRGSVQVDFFVKARGNVEIFGSICGGIVEGENIIVRMGIQGMNRSVIKARECLVTKFIENAIVYADQEIAVSDVVLNSAVFAGIRVIVDGQRGLVRGGRISAGEEIRALTIGNRANVPTEVEVAVNPFLKDELLQLRIERKKSILLYEEMNLSLNYIRSQGHQHLSREKQERYKKKEIEYHALVDRMEEIRERLSSIEALLASLKPGKILVRSIIYPGVKITIGSATKTLTDTLQYTSLYAHAGEIRLSSLR